MSRELRILVVILLSVSSLLAQNLTKEEEAVKAAIMQGATAYNAHDYEKWAEIVVQDDRYFGFVVDPDYLKIFNDWKDIEADAKDTFNKYSPYFGPIVVTDWKFVISGDMAFVRCKMGATPQVRVLLKEKGKWREAFFCNVSVGAYHLQQVLGSVEKFCGEWTYVTNSFHVEPEFKFPVNSSKLIIEQDGLTFEYEMMIYYDEGQQRMSFRQAWDEAKGVFRTQVVGSSSSGDSWVAQGITEINESGLVTKIFEKENAEKPIWDIELTLADADRMVMKGTDYDQEGKQIRVQTSEYQRK